jgi:hypothetical protein
LGRRYEIWPRPPASDVPLAGLTFAAGEDRVFRAAGGVEPDTGYGLRFAERRSAAIRMMSKEANCFRRPTIVVAPEWREEFLAELKRAMGRGYA